MTVNYKVNEKCCFYCKYLLGETEYKDVYGLYGSCNVNNPKNGGLYIMEMVSLFASCHKGINKTTNFPFYPEEFAKINAGGGI